MLQQTQVSRVTNHYAGFIAAFPTPARLASAPLADVVRVWTGLGYNRRALNLHRTAAILVARYAGGVPRDPAALLALPGVGAATAGAVMAFAFSLPSVFIETNIRRAFIAEFFANTTIPVADAALLPLVAATLDRRNPRRWYYALMDYGAALGRNGDNANRASAHYARQRPFQGSTRQLRGAVIRQLTQVDSATLEELAEGCARVAHRATPGEHVAAVVDQLVREGFLVRIGTSVAAFCITKAASAADADGARSSGVPVPATDIPDRPSVTGP